MTATLTQLAFSGALNSVYSVLLLLTIGLMLFQWFQLRKSRKHWQELWSAFEKHCAGRVEDLTKHEGPAIELKQQLNAHYLNDLVAHIEVYPEPPSAEETAHRMMELGLSSHVILEEKQPSPLRWSKWPGLAVLLGLLGTFIGLTLALTQLPLGGGIQQLNEGIRKILPIMSAAFWTSVCGLVASLVLRAYHSLTVRVENERSQNYQNFLDKLTAKIRRELYPHLAAHGVLEQKKVTPQQPESVFAPDVSPIIAKLEENQVTFLDTFGKQWEEWQGQWKYQQEQVRLLPTYLVPLSEELQNTQKVLHNWTQSIANNARQMVQVGQEVSNTLNPIAHTEQLLSERMTGLTRQHEALTGLVESLLEYEKQLPDKMKDLLESTLRPAHRILQRSGDGLNQSIEMVLERNTQEREAWRHEMQQLNERFQILERITQDAGLFTRELTEITSHLSEISDHMRFRPRGTQGQEEDGSESLDNEIDQLLESFDDRNAQLDPRVTVSFGSEKDTDFSPPEALPQEPEVLPDSPNYASDYSLSSQEALANASAGSDEFSTEPSERSDQQIIGDEFAADTSESLELMLPQEEDEQDGDPKPDA